MTKDKTREQMKKELKDILFSMDTQDFGNGEFDFEVRDIIVPQIMSLFDFQKEEWVGKLKENLHEYIDEHGNSDVRYYDAEAIDNIIKQLEST